MNAMQEVALHNKELAWKAFIKSGEIEQSAVAEPIAESWRKCASTGVNPSDGKGRIVLEQQALRRLLEENEAIVRAGGPFMDNLYQFFRASGFIVVLTDVHGYILESFGDSDRLKSARDINFLPGANWQDVSVGTNAIGTVLAQGKPSQVSGCEHFCLRHHCWTCSAAPITDQDGRIVAVLDISGPAQAQNTHTLGMVVAAAEAVSMQLRLQGKNSELLLANQRLKSIFNTMSEGVILIDRHGVINEVNAVIGDMLGKPDAEFVGRPIERILGGKAPLTRRMLTSREPYADVELMLPAKNGMSHYLASGEPITDAQGAVGGGVIILRPIKQVRSLVNRFSGYYTTFQFSDIIGDSPQIAEAVRVAALAASSMANVLLRGESGTGKELFAQAIHHRSPRSDGPFIAVNCGAIPRELIASELFGYEEGAFTGARRGGRPGKFELAAGGTLFLDEIGDMPLEQQIALLRVLQEKRVTRLGDARVIPTDVRVICATNKNLGKEVERGTFRQDLYYRLNVISITVPPLRERGDDVISLFNHFLNNIGKESGRTFFVDPAVLACLKRYNWPGNVRELHNVAERVASLAEGETITLLHLPPEIYNPYENQGRLSFSEGIRLGFFKDQQRRQRERAEREQILALLGECGGNITQVARRMDVARTTVYRKLRSYSIDV